MRRISHDLAGVAQRLNHVAEVFNHEAEELGKIWLDAKGRAFLQQHTTEVQPTINQLAAAIIETV
jgi:hypothetical protein